MNKKATFWLLKLGSAIISKRRKGRIGDIRQCWNEYQKAAKKESKWRRFINRILDGKAKK